MDNNRISIQNIAGLFSVILGTHYFLSFRWFYGMLKIWGIDSLAVISLEDLTFPYAHLNISVISLSSIGFLGIFWWKFASNKESNPPKDLKNAINLLRLFFVKQKSWIKIVGIIILIAILIFTYFKVFSPLISLPSRDLGFLYLGILLGVPILYVFLPEKRNLIFGLQLLLMFSWANLFINTILKNANSNKGKIKSQISFEYKEQRIESSDSLIFLHHGYNYLIMKDSKGNTILYPSNLVEKIIYKNDD